MVQILVKEDKDISEILDLEELTTSYGFSYELIHDYINGVCNMYFYQYYKSSLDFLLENKLSEEQIESLNQKEHSEKINTLIQEYKKAIYSSYFEDCLKTLNENGKPNMFYYSTLISNWRSQRSEEILNNPALSERVELLQSFNGILSLLMRDIITLFKQIDKGFPNERLVNAIMNTINIKGNDISRHLDSIENFAQIINHNINTNHFYLAIKIQNYCLLMFDDCLKLLEDQLFLRIYNSPLNDKFQSARKTIENSIDFDKLKILIDLSENKLENQTIESVIIKDKAGSLNFDNSSVENQVNPFPQIFTNFKGYKFFNDLHLEFKNSISILADYSFIYRMLIKENYILEYIKPEMFRSWLSKEPYEIVLDNKLKTLDRCSTNLKHTAYNTIKSNVITNS